MTRLPEIFLCRHGQTRWNAERRLQGQADVELNALGREQAARNGQRLRSLLGERARDMRFVASPLLRTRETMEIIRRQMGLEAPAYRTDPRLVELHFGDWQGFTTRQLRQKEPETFASREVDKWNFIPPGVGSESYAMLAERVHPFFDGLGAPTVVIAHGGVTRSFLWLYCGVTSESAAYNDVPQDLVLHRREDGEFAWV